MTFWEDAKPVVPRFRPRRRRPPRRAWLVAVAAATFLAVAITVFRPDGTTTTEAAAGRRRATPSRPRVVPAAWSRALPDEPSVLLADGGHGAVVVGRETVSAFSARGRLRWRTEIAEELQPVGALGGDTVLLATTAGFEALERRTGEPRWQTGTPETPLVVAVVPLPGPLTTVVVATEEGGLAGLDARTGRPRWSVRHPGRIRGEIVADAATGTVAAVWQQGEDTRLRVTDAASGTARFEHPLRSWAGSPAIVALPTARLVVVGAGSARYDGIVQAFDLADGRLRWRARVPASFQPGLVPTVDGPAVVIVDQLGNVTALDVASGRRRWSTRTRAAEIRARAVRAGDALLVTNLSGEVVTLDRRRGTLRARRRPAGFPVGLVVGQGHVLLAQRLAGDQGMQAFRVARLAAPARSPN
jgi:outer membrane protein assembly factor BamB